MWLFFLREFFLHALFLPSQSKTHLFILYCVKLINRLRFNLKKNLTFSAVVIARTKRKVFKHINKYKAKACQRTSIWYPLSKAIFSCFHVVKKISLFLSGVIAQVAEIKNKIPFKQELIEFLRQSKEKLRLFRWQSKNSQHSFQIFWWS